MKERIELLMKKCNSKFIWDEQPVFCFTSDIDWASEDVLVDFFNVINQYEIKPTMFVTHESEILEQQFQAGNIDRGIHPNFLRGSSHGDSYLEVVKTCLGFAPEAYGFRSHRAYDVTDITHLLKNDYNYKYVSHQITILQPYIRHILHESGLINFPVFFEDGTHLYNELDLDFKSYEHLFLTPGIKIISFHPMNFVFNSPTIKFMRSIKDSLSREEYNNITKEIINEKRNSEMGIGNTVVDIIEYVTKNNFPIFSMNELFNTIVK